MRAHNSSLDRSSSHGSSYSGYDKPSDGMDKLLRFVLDVGDGSAWQSEGLLLDRLRHVQGTVRGAPRTRNNIALFIAIRSTRDLEWRNSQQGWETYMPTWPSLSFTESSLVHVHTATQQLESWMQNMEVKRPT